MTYIFLKMHHTKYMVAGDAESQMETRHDIRCQITSLYLNAKKKFCVV